MGILAKWLSLDTWTMCTSRWVFKQCVPMCKGVARLSPTTTATLVGFHGPIIDSDCSVPPQQRGPVVFCLALLKSNYCNSHVCDSYVMVLFTSLFRTYWYPYSSPLLHRTSCLTGPVRPTKPASQIL